MIRGLLAITVSLILVMQASTASAASIVTEWLDQALPYGQEVAWEPTVGARFFAILHTAMYDAWTAYDPVAVGVVSGNSLKGLGGANNEANKREAISHAAFTVLLALAPQHRHALIERMQEFGYDPNADTPPARIGRRSAAAVLANRRDDGANESGNFADTTGYKPRTSGPPDAWRPIESLAERQLPTTPQWSRVMPFALARADQFRPVPPPAPGTVEWSRQIDVLIKTSGALTDSQKAAAEYWGIWGMNPVPQMIEMTKFVSDTNDLRLDDDIKLFFVASNAILDASIATWDAKYVYDYVRPITAIRALGDRRINAWRPRSLVVLAYSTPATLADAKYSVAVPAGLGEVRAADWEPYLPTPPFPSYVSGHSAFAAAWARAMELATGKPDFGFKVIVTRLYVEQRELAQPVTLSYPTFAAAAEASGISRVWAGVHWSVDNERGQELGRSVGQNAWDRAQEFLLGTASPATAALTALRAPFWFHQRKESGEGTKFPDGAGMAMDLAPGATGAWRSVALDPMPVGAYDLRLKIAASSDGPVRLKAAIVGSQGQGAAPVAESESLVPPNGGTVTLHCSSDGSRSFAVSVTAGPDAASAHVVVSAIDLVRVWPIVPGSPRFVEPSLAGRPSDSSN